VFVDATRRPRILFVYYTYTQQTLRVVEAMAEVFRDHGFEVQQAAIKFTDPHYVKRFSKFPMRYPFLEVLGMLLPELRRTTAEIRFPDEVLKDEYDLICIGSPTWWLSTSVPVRSFLQSDAAHQLLNGKRFTAFVACRRYWRHNLDTVKKLGARQGGKYSDGIHFSYQGGQVRSLLSLISYLGTGEYRERYLGIKIPPTNLQPYHLEEAVKFANGLADTLSGANVPAGNS
jgi:hypothetical protein